MVTKSNTRCRSVESVTRFESEGVLAAADVILNTIHDRRRPLATIGLGRFTEIWTPTGA